MKSKLVIIAKLAVTALLFVFLFWSIEKKHPGTFNEFGATLRNARLDILLLAFLVLWIGHYICIYRWRMLMRPLMIVPSTLQLFGIYCIGLFFNLTFPTVVGGDVVKMYYAGKPSKSYAQSFAATFLDRDAGMLAMMIIACSAILVYPIAVPGVPVSLIIWIVFAAFVLGNIGIFSPYFHRLLTGLLHRIHLSKMAKKVDTISSAFQIMGKHKSVLVFSLLISLINQLLVIAVTWIMARAIGINVNASYFLIFIPVITLISMIPISLNGMGLREVATVSLFRAIHVPDHSSMALGILSSIVTILASIPGGIVYIFFRNRQDLEQLATFETEFS